MEGGSARNLGHERDHVIILDKEVAQAVAEAEDEQARHHLKHHAQRYAHVACDTNARSSIA